jgi:hypothetical protein
VAVFALYEDNLGDAMSTSALLFAHMTEYPERRKLGHALYCAIGRSNSAQVSVLH